MLFLSGIPFTNKDLKKVTLPSAATLLFSHNPHLFQAMEWTYLLKDIT